MPMKKRKEKHHIPFDIFLSLAVTAKLKIKTSLIDVPFAINDTELPPELDGNAWNSERDINERIFSESVIRKLLTRCSNEE